MRSLKVVVRRDLTPSQQAVQGGHALAQFLLHHNTEWKNETLIYLGVKGRYQLLNIMDKLEWLEINYAQWCEPDMNNELMAIATDSNHEIFEKLNLL